jgi:3D (Asp-Asp-Asp) domain-containing protein
MGRQRTESAGCFALGMTVAMAAWLACGQPRESRDESSESRVQTQTQIPGPVAAPMPALSVEPAPPAPKLSTLNSRLSTRLGTFKLTRYHVASPDDPAVLASTRTDQVAIYDDRGCEKIAGVSRAFARELAMQGTGRLEDGRTVNVWKKDCGCARTPCYRVIGDDARWGVSADASPLEPFRTVAVDPDVVALGTRLYIPELDGLTMPGQAPWGGFVHDGCVIATDVGDRIEGKHVDLFVGRQAYKRALDARRPLRTVTVYDAGERCDAGQVAHDTGI